MALENTKIKMRLVTDYEFFDDLIFVNDICLSMADISRSCSTLKMKQIIREIFPNVEFVKIYSRSNGTYYLACTLRKKNVVAQPTTDDKPI